MDLVFLTTNHRKFEEAQKLLPGITLIRQEPMFPEIQGDPVAIITYKIEKAFEQVGTPVMVDDTHLIFEAWEYLPGPYINDFMQTVDHTGLYTMLSQFDNKNAIALAYVGYHDGQHQHIFKGEIHGTIVEPRGTVSFGWDPIFQPEGYAQTFAEMGLEGKNRISHRNRALAELQAHLGI